MRKLLVFLSLSLFIISCGGKELKKEIVPEKKVEEVKTPIVKKEEPKPTMVFTVQIRASKKKLKKYSSVENVLIFNEEGMYKYRLGSFKTYKEARSYRENLLQEFPGAFVQALKNNQPISIQEAIK